MTELDKVCTIGWDEMSLTANLNFDQIKDYIDGFEELGSKRTTDFSTHALVFMVRGIKSAYKQPIAYFLTQNLKADELATLIRLVIQAVTDTGELHPNCCFLLINFIFRLLTKGFSVLFRFESYWFSM